MVCGGTHAPECTWRSKDNLVTSVLSFHLIVCSRDPIQVARLAQQQVPLLAESLAGHLRALPC